jgi:hypothetical protein
MSAALYDYANLRYVCLTIKGLTPNQTYQVVGQYLRPNGNVEDINLNQTADEKGRTTHCFTYLDVTQGTFTLSLYDGSDLLAMLVYTIP